MSAVFGYIFGFICGFMMSAFLISFMHAAKKSTLIDDMFEEDLERIYEEQQRIKDDLFYELCKEVNNVKEEDVEIIFEEVELNEEDEENFLEKK